LRRESSTRFEGWYLRQHFRKRKLITAGLLIVVILVAMTAAAPFVYYFHIRDKETNTLRIESTMVRVNANSLNQTGIGQLGGLGGVQDVIPAVLSTTKLSIDDRTVYETVFYVTSPDMVTLASLMGLDRFVAPTTGAWFYFGYLAAQNDGIQIGKAVSLTAAGVGNATATASGFTYSDSDFYVFGDLQAYWASPDHAASGVYNYAFIEAVNSSEANAIGNAIGNAHPNWSVASPSTMSGLVVSATGTQLQFAVLMGIMSWLFGVIVFGTYIAREVSTRSKELVTFAALGASKRQLTWGLSSYLLILTIIGAVVGLLVDFVLALPEYEVLAFGYVQPKSLSTIAYTSALVVVPVLLLDVGIVLLLQWRLGRLDMMNFLRSEV
jgi:ABC-type antimicrobial peptide transport system permease subunit